MEKRQQDIVIIGAGLTGLTTAFHLIRKGKSVHILEKSERTGGQIRTFHEEGFIFESGPNTGVVSYPEIAELFDLLSPDCQLETAREESKNRWIWKNGRFHKIPSGLWGGLTTPLFSFPDKFRILSEPFRPRGTNSDESVAQMTKRRLGKSFLDYAVDPFLSGVYAGNPDTLITRYALPKLYNLEQQYGSFIKGSIAKARQPKTERDALATKKVFSARNGLESLIFALKTYIGSNHITTSASGVMVHPFEKGWEISFSTSRGEEKLFAKQVITTTGAYTLPDLLPFIDKKDILKISNLTYAPIVQVSVGVLQTGNLRFNAFGGLVPSKEKKDVLGILFPSSCFSGRAPEAGGLFSFFMGGVKRPGLIHLTNEELTQIVTDNFHSMLKFPSGVRPDLIRIFRHPLAIPQYEQSSGERFETIKKLQLRYPGLHLGGNIRDGIGMADRIRQATTLAEIAGK